MMNIDASSAPPALEGHAVLHQGTAHRAMHPARRRGRPPGARTRVIRDDPVLGRHHFAFLRACFQGLDAKVAWERYLGTEDHGLDRRLIERRRRQMLAAVLRAGRQRARTADSPQIWAALQMLYRQSPRTRAVPLPSLTSWVLQEGLDPDMYGEHELLVMYREHHGIDGLQEASPAAIGHSPRRAAEEQVRALNLLEPLLARTAQPDDPVALWVAPRLADGLQRLGMATLGDAWRKLGASSSSWYGSLRGIGKGQARTFLGWLRSQADAWTSGPMASPASMDTAPPPPCPFRLTAEDPTCRGVLMRLRGPGEDDRAALLAWLAGLVCAPTTRANYRREVERFLAWCVAERQVTLRQLAEDDVSAYASFLANVPATWTCRRPRAQADADWRPFRGALSTGSQRHALVVIRRLLADLRAQGYLAGPPTRGRLPALELGRRSAPAPEASEWAQRLVHAVEQMKPSPRARRLRAVVGWYVFEGRAFSAIAREGVPLDTTPAHSLPDDCGLPVKAHVRTAWSAHVADAGAWVAHAGCGRSTWPLILRETCWVEPGRASRSVSRKAEGCSRATSQSALAPLSAGAVRAILARLMRKVVSCGPISHRLAGESPPCPLRSLKGALA